MAVSVETTLQSQSETHYLLVKTYPLVHLFIMERPPPGSPSSSLTPGSSKGKGIGKGASNRTNQDQNNTNPLPHEETI